MPESPTAALEELQRTLATARAQWQAGQTSLTGLSRDARRLRLGAELERTLARESASTSEHVRAAGAAYPADFDWRNYGGQNYVTGVRDQGGCGSCVAFGVIGAVEGTFQVQRGNPNLGVDLSEAHLFYCYGASEGRNCSNGWWPDNAYNHVRDSGLVDEACFPYTAGDQGCNLCGDAASRLTKVSAWHGISDIAQMKDWLSSRGTISTCFTVYDDFFNYVSGVYHHVSGGVAGGHCVTVIGYSDTGGYWICKNSWGTGWGESGLFRIAYGDPGSGIDAEMWAVDGIVETGWVNGVTVIGLWAINEDLNAWAYISGLGWRKISPTNTNIITDMLLQLASAKAVGRPVNVYQDNGVITQLYVL
jgi:C1A family cysteine protease